MMATKHLDLHMNQKRAWIIMLSFGLMLILVGTFTVLSIGREFSQLSSLLRSDYDYSAILKNSVSENSYLQFDAGISFSTAIDDQSSINAVVLMQFSNSKYNKLVDWNAEILSPYGIAISSGIARQYGLNIGDKLFSKHIVDGTDYDYSIEQILPNVSSIRETDRNSFTEGIIIMGYDPHYYDNIRHSTIVYTKVPIDEVTAFTSDMPVNFVYRTDEILFVTQKITPYLLVFLLLSILLIYGLIAIFEREVRYNIKRMIMLGFDKKGIDDSFRSLIYRTCLPLIVMAFIVSIVVAVIYGYSSAEGTFLLLILTFEFLTMIITTQVFIRQLWR